MFPGFPAFPALRASDADRERSVAFLNEHCAQGRLSLDELSERTDAAYRAVGLSELDALTDDLPGSPFAPATPSPSRGTRARRQLRPALALALTALALVAFASVVPAEVWVPLVAFAVPLVAMVLFTVLPIALPVLAVAWVVRGLAQGEEHRPDLHRPDLHRPRHPTVHHRPVREIRSRTWGA